VSKTVFIRVLIFAVPVSLVLLLVPVASGQGTSEQSSKQKLTSQTLQTARQAEESLRQALAIAGTKERELTRLRLREAIRLWESIGEPEKAAAAAVQVGYAWKLAKRYGEALDYYQQALEVPPLQTAIQVLAFPAIAQIYAELYENDLALHYYQKALDQARLAKNHIAQIQILNGLAELYIRQEAGEQATACLGQAQQLNRLPRNLEAQATSLYLLAQMQHQQGKLEPARAALQEALTIDRKIGNQAGQIKVLCASSALCLSLADKQTALVQAEEAVKLAYAQKNGTITNADKLNARDLLWRAKLSLARAHRAAGRLDLAINAYGLAIALMEGNWWSEHIFTQAGAIASREELQAPYLELIDLYVEKNQIESAYDYLQRSRTRVLLGNRQARQTTRPAKPEKPEPGLRELELSIAQLRAQLLSTRLTPEHSAKLQGKLAEARFARQEMQVRAQIKPARKSLDWKSPITVTEMRQMMGGDKKVTVEFCLGQNRSFAWMISAEKVSLAILSNRNKLEKAVSKYLDSLAQAPNPRFLERDLGELRTQGEALFSLLFGSLAEKIQPAQKLIIIADGLLHNLPFEALMRNGRFLVEDYEISYLPCATILSLLPDDKDGSARADQLELLAFGDPEFAAPNQLSGRKTGTSIVTRLQQDLDLQLTPLPKTRDEVIEIGNLFPVDKRQIYLGKESTEEALKQSPLRRFRRLHFATHSLINERFPSRSAVALALGRNLEEDGLLEVSEISELDIDCELAVLSACQTGRGQIFSAEGIIGLSRAFLLSGARAVVVSLWNVADISTAQLMKNFYQQLITGQSNAKALRQAKLQMLRNGKETRHPYYWAPFILTGKP
jgi:CHAT domain-containing protein